jgi:hypothetical protein
MERVKPIILRCIHILMRRKRSRRLLLSRQKSRRKRWRRSIVRR